MIKHDFCGRGRVYISEIYSYHYRQVQSIDRIKVETPNQIVVAYSVYILLTVCTHVLRIRAALHHVVSSACKKRDLQQI